MKTKEFKKVFSKFGVKDVNAAARFCEVEQSRGRKIVVMDHTKAHYIWVLASCDAMSNGVGYGGLKKVIHGVAVVYPQASFDADGHIYYSNSETFEIDR